MFLLYGCSGQTNLVKGSNVIETATFPVNPTSLATKEYNTPLVTTTSTFTNRPQISKADLAIEFTPILDAASSEKNIYALTTHNQAQSLAADILITHVFPFGTNADQIHLLEPICQLQENDVVCDVGDAQVDSRMTITLDFPSGSDQPVLPEIRRSSFSPNIVLPVCSFEQITDQPLRLICRLESLKPGMQAQIQMELNPDIEPGIHRFSVAAAQIDPDLSNNTGSARIVPTPVKPATLPDLTVHATGPAEVIAGQPFTYTYLVINEGTGQATEVTLEDPIPPGLVLNSYAPALPLCDQKGDTFTCSLVDPDSGEKVAFTLDINGNENQLLRMDVDSLMPGWPVCYVLKEPDHLLLHCDLGTLQPGQSTHVRMEMLAIGVQERITMNTVVIQSSESDLAPTDNTNSTNILIQARADLQIHAAPPTWSAAEKTLTYMIEVKNLGPSAADDSLLTGALPSGAQLVSADLEPGRECQVQADNTLTCNLVYTESGETAPLTLVLSVEDGFAPESQAEAFLRSLQAASKALDPNPDNNVIVGPITISTGEAQ